ncbi:AzlD domain-containing protein [Sciscionella sediminilitoris]|uniref:AzlD domain-containing protein n=1 Tax=Sciscionella sediminilitoris TaxID=1445613 RepID=UPI0004DF6D04|nr:AzlD domain-containing protein [Sciscionella sp. SE31]
MPLIAILILALGTYAIRLTGPLLAGRVEFSARTKRVLTVSATILLAALAATTAVFAGEQFAGWARPAGVAVGVLLALRRAPLVVVVLAAAGTAAGLRALGVA